MFKRYLHIFCFFCLNFVFSCTFGSIGDANKENLTILQNLLVLTRDIRTPLNSQLQFFGDEIDAIPERFVLRSGNQNYQIELLGESFVTWGSGNYRINPASTILSPRSVETKTHTPFTVPLDLPVSDPYAVSYSFLRSGTEQLKKDTIVSTQTGFTHLSTSTRITLDSPIGNVSLVTISWEELVLRFSIVGLNTKDVKLILRPGIQTIRPKCRIEINQGKSVPVAIAFQYGNLFRDRSDSGSNNGILANIDSISGSEIIISSVSQVGLYETIRKNLLQEDLSFFLPRCIPGATL